MTGSVNFSNHQWLVRSLDTNKNGAMDELRMSQEIGLQVDTDRNGQVSDKELVGALQADRVEIQQGEVVKGRGFNIFVNGLETLKNVRSTANNGISNLHVWTPTMYSDDTSRERFHKLRESNSAYDRGIDQMENSLRSIVDMTAGKTDATSRALHIQAKTTLNSTQWRTFAARFQQNISVTRDLFSDFKPGEKMAQYSTPQGGSGTTANTQDPFANSNGSKPSGGVHSNDPFAGGKPSGGSHTQDPFANGNNGGGHVPAPVDPYAERLSVHIAEQQMILNSLQSSYEQMNSTLKAIKEQCNDLPDLQASIQATDRSISQAFGNLNGIENSGKTGAQVADKIRTEAKATEAKATGRTGPFAGIGAGIGLVAGGAIGYFASGRNITKAALGAAGGAAAAAGIGALIGSGIDKGYKGQASSLNELAGRVESYNPGAERATVMKSNQTLYNQLFSARDARDLDRARVVNNDVNAVRSQVTPVVDRSAEILGAHQKY